MMSPTSLYPLMKPSMLPTGHHCLPFLGSWRGRNRRRQQNSITIIGDHTDLYVQAYFSYDSKKSGGVTISDLRFGKHPIRSTYLVNKADFIACHNQSYINKYDMLKPLKPGGVFLLNTQWTGEELEKSLPGAVKRFLARNKIKFYIIDAVSLAMSIGLGGRINTICQAAFFKLANVIPVDDAVEYMKMAIVKSYGSKGEEIVNMNFCVVDAGINAVQAVESPNLGRARPMSRQN